MNPDKRLIALTGIRRCTFGPVLHTSRQHSGCLAEFGALEQISVSARTYCPQRCAVRQCRSCIYRDGRQAVGQARIVFPKRDVCKCNGRRLCMLPPSRATQAQLARFVDSRRALTRCRRQCQPAAGAAKCSQACAARARAKISRSLDVKERRNAARDVLRSPEAFMRPTMRCERAMRCKP